MPASRVMTIWTCAEEIEGRWLVKLWHQYLWPGRQYLMTWEDTHTTWGPALVHMSAWCRVQGTGGSNSYTTMRKDESFIPRVPSIRWLRVNGTGGNVSGVKIFISLVPVLTAGTWGWYSTFEGAKILSLNWRLLIPPNYTKKGISAGFVWMDWFRRIDNLQFIITIISPVKFSIGAVPCC